MYKCIWHRLLFMTQNVMFSKKVIHSQKLNNESRKNRDNVKNVAPVLGGREYWVKKLQQKESMYLSYTSNIMYVFTRITTT